MRRRDFLRFTGAVAALGPAFPSIESTPAATVLYDDHSVQLSKTLPDSRNSADALWVHKSDLPKINGFELKPQGACRADVCIPIGKEMMRGEYFNLTSFAGKIGQ